jgi:hypothetical protein
VHPQRGRHVAEDCGCSCNTLVGSALSTSAFVRGGEGRIAGDGDYRGRASALRGGFHRDGRHDVWGHWGAYYGPTVAPMRIGSVTLSAAWHSYFVIIRFGGEVDVGGWPPPAELGGWPPVVFAFDFLRTPKLPGFALLRSYLDFQMPYLTFDCRQVVLPLRMIRSDFEQSGHDVSRLRQIRQGFLHEVPAAREWTRSCGS